LGVSPCPPAASSSITHVFLLLQDENNRFRLLA
jgi:hypothetical protein